MVKSLKFVAHSLKWVILLCVIAFLGLAIWLHEGARSLSFAKPWIESTINTPDAPFAINLGDVVIDWRNAAELGKLQIKSVTFSRRDGSVFAQFPELYATVDPLGFLPNRRLLGKVILRQPHLFAARTQSGEIELGFEGAPERLPFKELVAFIGSGNSDKPLAKPSLPFHDFIIDNARLAFTDEKTGTNFVSEAFDFKLSRHHGAYDAVMALPFTVDAVPVVVAAGMRALPQTREHVVAVQLKQFPVRLACLFDTCPEGVDADGAVDGTIAVAMGEDLAPRGFTVNLATSRAKLVLPKLFAESIKLGPSSLALEGDWEKKLFKLTSATLKLEDTSITAKAEMRHAEDGWYVTADANCTQLDIKKVYKYWPLTMAPDSRNWVTGKLKSGYAASGKLKLNLTPADFAAEYFSDKSVDAVADARDITFEYLPGFPLAEKMNGIAHFTGTTVKVEGGGATLMDGTKIHKAVLWCPKLMSNHNPMEATLELTAPASDVATMLALKHFAFDDPMTLDAKTLKGSADATMLLKFNAFSDKPSKDPNEIHFEAVDYDIAATLKDVSQKGIAGSYDVHGLNGKLAANTSAMSFDGALALGELTTQDVSFKQTYGKPFVVAVKGRGDAKGGPANDFTLTYGSGEVPAITLSGKRLDASVSFGSKNNSPLVDFPAMKLSIDLGELLLASDAAMSDVKGTLNCNKLRCESADITARAGKADLRTTIGTVGGVRQFSMTANDAGSMLKALGITDRMSGGKFELRGPYNDNVSPPQLDAKLLISDFTLKNSQILGRIFSIGSLTGLANALTGSGIAFDKLSANLISKAGLITVDKGSARGTSMGITFGGTVDTVTSSLNIKGVIAPAYALNSILGKIPLIGAIAGGEEGLIAFNYFVKGPYDDPKVGVNPLSGLTPGFLRGIFGGGADSVEPRASEKPETAASGGSVTAPTDTKKPK